MFKFNKMFFIFFAFVLSSYGSINSMKKLFRSKKNNRKIIKSLNNLTEIMGDFGDDENKKENLKKPFQKFLDSQGKFEDGIVSEVKDRKVPVHEKTDSEVDAYITSIHERTVTEIDREKVLKGLEEEIRQLSQ